MNIPLYRAKKIDSDEYVNGTYVSSFHKHYIAMINCIHENNYNQIVFDEGYFEEIDTSTLAIHFGGMIDKNGVKIFAGLRVNNAPDRKCGDLVKLGQHKGRVVQARGEIFINSGDSYAFYQNHKDGFISKFEWNDLEVTGIQE